MALQLLYAKPNVRLNPQKFPGHFHPQPRIAVGKHLRERGLAAAMIDLSDGLSTDLDHLCQESGVRAQISSELIPRSKDTTLEQALHGGEDYELLFTAPADRKIGRSMAGVPISRIGEILRPQRCAPRVTIFDGKRGSELRPHGWEHFATPRNLP